MIPKCWRWWSTMPHPLDPHPLDPHPPHLWLSLWDNVSHFHFSTFRHSSLLPHMDLSPVSRWCPNFSRERTAAIILHTCVSLRNGSREPTGSHALSLSHAEKRLPHHSSTTPPCFQADVTQGSASGHCGNVTATASEKTCHLVQPCTCNEQL